MNPTFVSTLVTILWCLGTFFAVLGAWFKFRSAWLSNPSDKKRIKKRYLKYWTQINQKKYLYLAEMTILKFINAASNTETLRSLFFRISLVVQKWFVSFCIVALVVFFVFKTKFLLATLTVCIYLYYLFCHNFFLKNISKLNFIRITSIIIIILYFLFSYQYLLILSKSDSVYWIALIVVQITSFLIALTVVSLRIPMFTMKLSNGNEITTFTNFGKAYINVGNFLMIFAISSFLTTISIYFGASSQNDLINLASLQVLISNLVFDSLTIISTVYILKNSLNLIKKVPRIDKMEQVIVKRKYPILIAIVIDILIAAILACLSLFFALLGTENALSLFEIINILLGLAPNGKSLELSSFFWVMHTTFIPTLIYLTIILFGYIGKFVVLPFYHILKRGNEIEKPHNLTAMTFVFFATVFISIAGLISKIFL